MAELDRRAFLLGSIMTGGAAAAVIARPAAPPPPISQQLLEASIPRVLGGYHDVQGFSAVMPPRDALSERIYDRYLVRGYVSPSRPPITVVIAYGSTQDYGLQLHRPETCYPASGWQISAARALNLPLEGAEIKAQALSARRPGRIEEVLYWTRIGNEFPSSGWETRVSILRSALRRHLPDGVSVRLSTNIGPTATALDALIEFNSHLLQSLTAGGRQLVLGQP